MFRPKSWLPGMFSKPKNPHSLDHLKYLYTVLCKNQTVTENNRGLLVETLRSISEILIWGDQNDSSVFDFFLEKNMLSFFIRYLRQKSGRYICVQLLQTLNILFENISNETSLYYLLSNNHINSIIIHKFDFSDEEVMAYYISFLKTLSLKLNKHTIHFFYNEHTNDFALYTEAIKFFNHSESMVRIAVRTITLNVYKVDDKAMLRYIRDKTAAPYFSNLVWFIGNHILDLETCVRNDADLILCSHQSRDRLADLVAEHLDHLHYLNDILCIGIDTLNEVLTDQFLNRLLIPLYVYSLTKRKKYSATNEGEKKHVSSVVALFLLSQVFLILSHAPLVRQLAEIIFNGDISLTRQDTREMSPRTRVREFAAPKEPLAKTLENSGRRSRSQVGLADGGEGSNQEGNSTFYTHPADEVSSPSTEEALSPSSPGFSTAGETDMSSPNQNSTDEEKLLGILHRDQVNIEQRQADFSLANRPYLEAIFNALECSENDYETLFALCLLYAMGHNEGIHQGLLDSVLMPTDRSETKEHYNVVLVERLIRIITLACQQTSKVRLATLELSIKLLKQLVYTTGQSYLQDRHLACVENAREGSTQLLRNFYKSEEIFLDMFEDEYRELKTRPLNVEYLMMDSSILLPPAGTPLTGIDFNKRLPCGEVERARRAIRVFFLLRDLSLTLMQETEGQLPLTCEESCVKIKDVLDLNNSDLIACTVLTRESRKQERRFLVIDSLQLILVEPDTKRLGWGVVRFVGFLQDVEVSGDKDDSRSLHVTIHKPAKTVHARPIPLLAAKFVFDDHIRCMAAKQRLVKGRLKARQQKMQMIERLLEIPLDQSLGTGLYSFGAHGSGPPVPGRVHPVRQKPGTPGPEKSAEVKVGGRTGSGLPIPPSKQTSKQKAITSTPAAATTRYTNPPVLPQELRSQQMQKEDSEEVEEGVDATSPSAFAFQILNPQSNSNCSSPQRKHSRASSEGGNGFQEIPLEDLSKRSPRRRLSGIEKVGHTILSSSIQAIRGRSQSHSPRRGRSSSSPTAIPVLDQRPKGGKERSRSLTSERAAQESDRGSPVRRASQIKSGRSKLSSLLQSYNMPATTTTPSSSDGGIPSARTMVEQSPKTLLPAKVPPTSLLPESTESDSSVSKTTDNSPMLVPPVEPGRIRSLSETSTGSQDKISNTTPPSFTYSPSGMAGVDVTSAGVETTKVETAKVGEASASVQLTKLAQMVQEHYSFVANPKDLELATVEGREKDKTVMDI